MSGLKKFNDSEWVEPIWKREQNINEIVKIKPMAKQPKLEHITLIGFFSDGKHRQILVKEETGKAIQSLIVAIETNIRVLETPIESINL